MRPAKTQISLGIHPVWLRVFTVRRKKAWVLSYPLNAQQKLIRLGGYPGWSKSLLGAHAILLVFVMRWLTLAYFFRNIETGHIAQELWECVRPIQYWGKNSIGRTVTVEIHVLWNDLSRDMTKPTKWMCAQRRLRSAWPSAQSDQSSLSAWRKLGSLATH